MMVTIKSRLKKRTQHALDTSWQTTDMTGKLVAALTKAYTYIKGRKEETMDMNEDYC